MDRIRRRSLLGDLKLGEFLLASIASCVWSNGGSCTLSLGMVLVGFGWMVVKDVDDFFRVDLMVEISAR